MTLVFQDLRVLLLAAVERHAHLPRPAEDFGILDGGLIQDVVGSGASVSLHHMKSFAVIVPGAVKPGLVREMDYVHHQRLSLPAGARVPLPPLDRTRGVGAGKENIANRVS